MIWCMVLSLQLLFVLVVNRDDTEINLINEIPSNVFILQGPRLNCYLLHVVELMHFSNGGEQILENATCYILTHMFYFMFTKYLHAFKLPYK